MDLAASSGRRPGRDDLSATPWMGPVDTARLDQPYSESQASILRQAASILGVPVNTLSENLRDNVLSTPSATFTDSLGASVDPQYGIEIGNAQPGFQSSFASDANGWSNRLPEAELAPNPSSSYMFADGNTYFQERHDPFLWSHVRDDNTQSTLPFMPGTSPSNSMDQYESDPLGIFGPTSPDARSSLPRHDSGTSQGSTAPGFGPERAEFVFQENSVTRPDDLIPLHHANGLCQWGNDMSTSSWVLFNPPEIPSMDHRAESMNNTITEDVDVTGSPVVDQQPRFQIYQAPSMTIQATQPRQPSPSSASSSSWVITTPPSLSSQNSSSDRALTPEAYDNMFQSAVMLGPCSKTWELPPRRPQKKKLTRQHNEKRTRPSLNKNPTGPRRRGAFPDEETREITAFTRQLKACIRCRMQRKRCIPDPDDPHSSCLTCRRVSGQTLSRLPCLRYIITDASLYREQTGPYELWTKRWSSMDPQDITEWASSKIKIIEVTQGFSGARERIEVREFIPVEGDLLEEVWNSDGVVKRHKCPPYAVANVEKAAQDLRQYLDDNISAYIVGAVGQSDALLWSTYYMAFKQSKEAPSDEERTLLTNALRLWCSVRKTSHPEWICGEETLGTPLVDDPSSPWFAGLPIPPVMVAQYEMIAYSKLLRPLSKVVLDQLQGLIIANKRKYWLTIYLTLFMLLHSCAMVTRRDKEYARQLLLEDEYANPGSIAAHHTGALTMLAHFHYINKGSRPFALALNPPGLQELAEAAELNVEQTSFVRNTAVLVQERGEFPNFRDGEDLLIKDGRGDNEDDTADEKLRERLLLFEPAFCR